VGPLVTRSTTAIRRFRILSPDFYLLEDIKIKTAFFNNGVDTLILHKIFDVQLMRLKGIAGYN